MFPQPHTVTIVTPVEVTDRRQDTSLSYGDNATRTVVQGWVQQIVRPPEETLGDRDVRISEFTLFSTSTPDLTAIDQVEWNGQTFNCAGQPNHLSNPDGYHHTEARLQLVEG